MTFFDADKRLAALRRIGDEFDAKTDLGKGDGADMEPIMRFASDETGDLAIGAWTPQLRKHGGRCLSPVWRSARRSL